jgi:hypothetical protein
MTHTSLLAAGRSDGYEHLLVILISVTYTSCSGVHQVKESFKLFISVGFNTQMFMPDCDFLYCLCIRIVTAAFKISLLEACESREMLNMGLIVMKY